MPTYSYEGLTKAGIPAKGTREAVSRQALISALMAEGVLVSDAKEIKGKRGGRFGKLFASRKTLSDTFFQLSLLLRSGIPLVEAVKVVANGTASSRWRNALLDVSSRVTEGLRFSDALKPHANLFDPMYVNLIRASEQVGRLSHVLADIARYEEEKKKSSDKLTSALVYPLTVLALGFGVLGFLLSFVVPRMQGIFTSMKQEIPASTRALLAVSSFLSQHGVWVLAALFLSVMMLRMYYTRSEPFRLSVDKRILRNPLALHVALAKLSHVLAFQLREGLPLVEAVKYAVPTVSNRYLREKLEEVRIAVQSGRKFSDAVKHAGVFGELFPAAVATGEKSGNLPDLLDRVSEYYGKKSEQLTAMFVSLAEPLFIVFIGLLVGFIVISIMEPLFSMNSMAGG